MYEIPTSVEINGREFRIRNNGDFRVILDCFIALDDVDLTANERLLSALIIFYEDFNSIEDVYMLEDATEFVSQMYTFFNCGKKDATGTQTNHKLVDWQKDEQLICSAINAITKEEVRSIGYMHWWTFMGYYSAIGDCTFSTIVRIRDKSVRGKRLEKYEREFKRDNPQYFIWNDKTIEEKEAEKLIKEIWNSEEQ